MGIGSNVYMAMGDGVNAGKRHYMQPGQGYKRISTFRPSGVNTGKRMGDITDNAKQQLAYVQQALRNAGFPMNAEQFAMVMAYGETAGFTSNVFKQDNNASGIKWLNKPYQVATRGLPAPKSEGGYYAHFSNLQAWANDLKRILSFGAKPIQATTLPDFVHRLKQNHYFGTTEAAYLKMLQGVAQRMRIVAMLDEDAHTHIVIPPDAQPGDKMFNDKKKGFWDSIPTWAKYGGAAFLGIMAINALKR